MTIQSGSPAATLVDYFPLMRLVARLAIQIYGADTLLRYIPTWAPFSAFKRDALEVKAAVEQMMTIPYEQVKEEIVMNSFTTPIFHFITDYLFKDMGTAPPSLTSRLIKDCLVMGTISDEDVEDIKGVAGTLYSAAEDTVSFSQVRWLGPGR